MSGQLAHYMAEHFIQASSVHYHGTSSVHYSVQGYSLRKWELFHSESDFLARNLCLQWMYLVE